MYLESDSFFEGHDNSFIDSDFSSSQRLLADSYESTLVRTSSGVDVRVKEEAMFFAGLDLSSAPDIYGSGTPNDAKVWLGNRLDGQLHGERVLRPRSLGASLEFTNAIEQSLKQLPKNLQEVMKDYSVYTAQVPDKFIEELRQIGNPVKESEVRTVLRDRVAATDTEGLTQHFVEWRKSPENSPYRGRYVHFTETHNLLGTASHEAEHANDAKLGFPSQNDVRFDELYRRDAGKILDQTGKDGLGWLAEYIRVGENGSFDGVGKSELFADLAAIAAVGEPANRGITAERLVAFFPDLYEYVKGKVQSGVW